MQDNSKLIIALKESGEFTEIDIHFADFITGLAKTESSDLFLASAIVSAEIRNGNICADLNYHAGTKIVNDKTNDEITLPTLNQWLNSLKSLNVIGQPEEFKPLILDQANHLYLYRWWEYEQILAEMLKKRVGEPALCDDINNLSSSLNRMFPDDGSGEFDYQKLAAYCAIINKFCVITGGPGTGKTATVTKILALLLEQKKDLRIALATPTGKAAARLQESITNSLPGLACSDEIKKQIPTQTSTIHRLLGSIRNSPYFRYNATNRLPYDVVVIDEASMVDLALMSKLVQALPDEARLILIGDKDQLASVESSAILGDICAAIDNYDYAWGFKDSYAAITNAKIPHMSDNENSNVVRDHIVELQRSYRFGQTSGIGNAGRAVNRGDSNQAIAILRDDDYADIQWSTLPDPVNIAKALRDFTSDKYEEYLRADNPQTAIDLFNRFRILCAIQKGPYGVEAINYHIERLLAHSGLIDIRNRWYKGRPVMITQNDYRLNLYNGDIGIIYPDADSNGESKAWFASPDGILRKFSPIRLPRHETVYAMTIHKSQGSEFDEILMILPDKDTPVLTRELIYTGLTRARHKAIIWGTDTIIRPAIERRVIRLSGLKTLLWD